MTRPGLRRRLAVRAARALRRRRSVVLCYHGVAPSRAALDPHLLRVEPARFAAQVDVLIAAGFEFVTVAELVARAGGGRPPNGLVALSFDDGMDDNHAVALPLLRARGIRATVYVVSGLVGSPNPWIDPRSGARMMTDAELLDLVAAGFEIGAHTVSHPDLSTMGFDACLSEMRRSRAALEQLTGRPVTTFAYPFCRYGDDALRAAQAAGFTAAVTCEGRGAWRPFELQRTMVTGKDRMMSFLVKLAGVYDPFFHSVPGRLARAGSRPLRQRVDRGGAHG